MNDRSRPNGAAVETPAKVSSNRVGDIIRPRQTDSPALDSIDLLNLTGRERTVWDAAYQSGYLAGHDAGAHWADERAEAIHRRAARVVHSVARLPEAAQPPQGRERERARLLTGPVREGRRSA